MNKFIIPAILLSFAGIQAAMAIQLNLYEDIPDAGTYTCAYKGKQCIVMSDGSQFSKSGFCPKTSSELDSLLNSSACKYKKAQTGKMDKYLCRYPSGNCTVIVRGGTVSTASCVGLASREQAKLDYKKGKCSKQ